MAKKAVKPMPPPAPAASAGNRVHFCFLWRAVEFEGEGKIAVYGGLIVVVSLVAWLIFAQLH